MSAGKKKSALSAYSSHNRVKLIRGGSDYFLLLQQLIDGARHSIHLQTYIFDDDETGKEVGSALMKAANRGVKVYLLLDGYASQHLHKEFIQQMKNSGIQFRWFEPVFRGRYFYFGRRLHHKIVVIDELHSLVSGVNISNRYNDMPGKKAWLDWALYNEGDASAELFGLCVEYWNKSGFGKKKKPLLVTSPDVKPITDECLVRVRRNDWVRRKNQINRSYLEMFKKAESHIIIMSSYFLPGRAFRKNMANAVKRGVKIQVIAAGPSDVSIAKYAERYLYNWMFRNKIELYEYQPNILHGKMSTYDSKFVTIGSYNVNNISAYASVELNLDIQNESFAGEVEQALKKIMANDCIPVSPKEFKRHNNIIKQFWQRTSYDIIRIIFYLFTFYFKQRS